MFRVLIVDNNTPDLAAFADGLIWAECGFEIAGHTSDLQQAVLSAMRRDFDMIVCINRPTAMIASELLGRLRQKKENIPTIIISQTDDPQEMRKCFLHGAVDYMIEPLTENVMRDALMRAAESIRLNIRDTEYLSALEKALGGLPKTETSMPMLEKLRAYLLETKDVPATALAAADYFGFHRDYFGRYFKSRAGMTFTEFYKGFTVEYARLLLESGHYKVSDVSRLLGFSSADYFSRIFKKHTGRSPSEFKKS